MKPQTKFPLGPIFRPLSILALMVFVAAIPQTIDAQSEPQAAQRVYLPLIVYSPIEASGCQLTAEGQQVLNLLKEHPEQARSTITCHPLLEAVASARAQDMAERDYFAHVNPDGYGPNYLYSNQDEKRSFLPPPTGTQRVPASGPLGRGGTDTSSTP